MGVQSRIMSVQSSRILVAETPALIKADRIVARAPWKLAFSGYTPGIQLVVKTMTPQRVRVLRAALRTLRLEITHRIYFDRGLTIELMGTDAERVFLRTQHYGKILGRVSIPLFYDLTPRG